MLGSNELFKKKELYVIFTFIQVKMRVQRQIKKKSESIKS